MALASSTPSLTVKALAEMLRMPGYEQARVLHEQKYPKQQPQSFRTPYYQRALSGIREYFRSGNDPSALVTAQNDLQNIANATRRANNLRVVEKFSNSTQARRKLTPIQNRRYSANVGSVEVRLSPDLQAFERGELRVIYFNCRSVAIPEEIAALTIEIAHWVLAQNQVKLNINQVEVVDLATGRNHRRIRARPTTVKALRNNARVIEALWAVV
jgi:hypothetical protein